VPVPWSPLRLRTRNLGRGHFRSPAAVRVRDGNARILPERILPRAVVSEVGEGDLAVPLGRGGLGGSRRSQAGQRQGQNNGVSYVLSFVSHKNLPLLTESVVCNPRSTKNAARLLTAVTVAARYSGTETQLVLIRRDERADHCAIVVRLAVVDYVQPEVEAALIQIAAEIAEVLHQHKSWVVLADLLEFAVTRIVCVGN